MTDPDEMADKHLALAEKYNDRVDDLHKWKSRCASLTAEVSLLRSAISYAQKADTLGEKFCLMQANRIKAEREAQIDPAIELKITAQDANESP